MGDAGPANASRGVRHHRPQDSVGSPPRKTTHKRPRPWWRALEGTGAAQGRPNQIAHPREGPLQRGPKLAPRSSKAEDTPKLNVGKHCKRLAQRKTGTPEVGPILHRRDLKTKDWKSLSDLGLSYHTTNREALETITNSIPWRPDEQGSQVKKGDWIAKPTPEWVYLVLECAPATAKVFEFRKTDPKGRIQASLSRPLTIATNQYRQIRVLLQDYPGSALKIAREPPDPRKKQRTH
ncbi:unnamed protein product [Sphagnum troendelagicum]|uniref:LAGLIDADG homing endonuclease n=1 Tax=Sphagnum troendelagicum TaxID=128251 RepID=A0ABP0U2R6_9BRYO